MSSEKSEFQKELGVRLWSIRLQFGLSQQDFAKKVGRSQSTIARIEAGDRLADTELIARVVEEFHCDANWLLARQVPPIDSGFTKIKRMPRVPEET